MANDESRDGASLKWLIEEHQKRSDSTHADIDRRLKEISERLNSFCSRSDLLVTKEQAARDFVDLERRLTEMNQFRKQIDHERQEYMRKSDYDFRHDQLLTRHETDVKALTTRAEKVELTLSNVEGRVWMLTAIGGIIIALGEILQLILHFYRTSVK